MGPTADELAQNGDAGAKEAALYDGVRRTASGNPLQSTSENSPEGSQ